MINRGLGLIVVVMGLVMAAPLNPAWAQAPAAPAAAPAAAAAATPAATGEGALVTPDAAAAANKGGEHDINNMNFWTIVARAGWFGALIWLGLITCSIISVALIVDSYMTIREKVISPAHLVEAVRGAMEEGDILKAVECCDRTPCPLAGILRAGFSNVEGALK